MNNLTRNQMNAKEAVLNHQQEQMLSLYENASREERTAIIGHVNSFLSTCNPDEKKFWLKFRRKLERLNESAILFPLGRVFLTVGAREALEESSQNAFEFLNRHQTGDWGVICDEDQRENELSLREGFRLLSSYLTSSGVKL